MCEININAVYGIKNSIGKIASINVEGSVSECDVIRVRIQCQSSSQFKNVNNVFGEFRAFFSEKEVLIAECNCEQEIKVLASCLDNEECFDEWIGVLKCNHQRKEGDGPIGCINKSESLLECTYPSVMLGPQYSLPYHQALPYSNLDVFVGDEIEHQEPLMFACVSLDVNGVEAHIATDLLFHQDWYFLQIGISDLVSSLSLTPGEQQKLSMKKTQRKLFQQSTLDSVEELDSSESTLIDKDVINVTRSSSKTENWKIDGSGGIRLGFFNIGVGAGYSKSINDTATAAKQVINESTKKSAKNLKSLQKIEVKELSEETAEQVSVRTITNPYKDRSLIIKVFSLTKKYCVETYLVRASPMIMIVLKKLKFDYNFVLSNGSFLSEYLLDPDLQIELPAALETVIDLRESDNIKRAIEMSKLSLKLLFEYPPNIFNVPQIPWFGPPPPGIDPNNPKSSFDGSIQVKSGLEDALETGYGIIFTILNFYYTIYDEYIKGKNTDPITLPLDIALSLEKALGSIWNAGAEKELERVGDILDTNNLTECFRRLGGFLTFISGVVRPLVQYYDEEKELELAMRKADLVIDRTIKHMKCHSDYYTEKYLNYMNTMALHTVKSFVKHVIKNITNNDDLKNQFYDVFDLERIFINRNEIFVPIRNNKSHEDIKSFTTELKQQDLSGIEVNIKDISEIEVPFDGVHIEAVASKCILNELPTGSSYSLDADIKLKPET